MTNRRITHENMQNSKVFFKSGNKCFLAIAQVYTLKKPQLFFKKYEDTQHPLKQMFSIHLDLTSILQLNYFTQVSNNSAINRGGGCCLFLFKHKRNADI